MITTKSEVKALRWYSEEPIFYVYVHKRPIIGTVFYVGKGRDERAWVEKSRNPHWRNVVNKHGGFDTEIIKQGMTEPEAYAFEAETILKYGIENLTNQTLGGISTTGYRHTKETRKAQSQIAKNRFQNDPEHAERLMERMSKLSASQTPEFREKALARALETTRNYSPDEREDYISKKTAWLKDEEKLAASIEKRKSNPNHVANSQRTAERMKAVWANMSNEDRKIASDRSKSVIMREDVRQKVMEKASIKIVVNRTFVFPSIKSLLRHTNHTYPSFTEASRKADKLGIPFYVANALFIENYDDARHGGIPIHNGETLRRLDFDVLPRTKAVVMDEERVFLSMKEASIFCNGKSIDATADFITKNIKKGKSAMGHMWRIASKEEVIQEVMRRVEKLDE